MKSSSKYILAFMAASVVPALAIVIPYAVGSSSVNDDYFFWIRVINFGIIAFSISATHVALLGLPLFLIMSNKKVIYWWSSILAGFVLGAIPFGFWAWPLQYGKGASSSHWDGEKMVTTLDHVLVTHAGWLSYIEGIAYMGAFGALGGLSFWLTWHVFALTHHSRRTPNGTP